MASVARWSRLHPKQVFVKSPYQADWWSFDLGVHPRRAGTDLRTSPPQDPACSPPTKVAIKSAKKATAPRPVKRTAAARLAIERERRARRPPPVKGTGPS